jgi:hypothetical protein
MPGNLEFRTAAAEAPICNQPFQSGNLLIAKILILHIPPERRRGPLWGRGLCDSDGGTFNSVGATLSPLRGRVVIHTCRDCVVDDRYIANCHFLNVDLLASNQQKDIFPSEEQKRPNSDRGTRALCGVPGTFPDRRGFDSIEEAVNDARQDRA